MSHATFQAKINHAQVVARIGTIRIGRSKRIVFVVEKLDLAIEFSFTREREEERLFVREQLDTWIVNHKTKGNVGFISGFYRGVNTGILDPCASEIFQIVVGKVDGSHQGYLASASLRLSAWVDGSIGLYEHAVGAISDHLHFELKAALEFLSRNDARCEEGQEADGKCAESSHCFVFCLMRQIWPSGRGVFWHYFEQL